MDFLQNITVWRALIIILTMISADTILGILVAIFRSELKLHVAKLPQFLKTNVLPFMGALTLLAGLQEYMTEFETLLGTAFYTSATFVLAKFVVEIKDKLQCLFSKQDYSSQAVGDHTVAVGDDGKIKIK